MRVANCKSDREILKTRVLLPMRIDERVIVVASSCHEDPPAAITWREQRRNPFKIDAARSGT